MGHQLAVTLQREKMSPSKTQQLFPYTRHTRLPCTEKERGQQGFPSCQVFAIGTVVFACWAAIPLYHIS